jgi:hypothetical protein
MNGGEYTVMNTMNSKNTNDPGPYLRNADTFLTCNYPCNHHFLLEHANHF